VTEEDLFYRLAVLPECPQRKSEVTEIDWTCQINLDGTSLNDYLVQFWERELYYSLGEREVDWTKFYKNLVLAFAVSDDSQYAVVPWAHTCLLRLEVHYNPLIKTIFGASSKSKLSKVLSPGFGSTSFHQANKSEDISRKPHNPFFDLYRSKKTVTTSEMELFLMTDDDL